MTTPRISAYLWTCHRCHAKRVWPLERHPSPSASRTPRARPTVVRDASVAWRHAYSFPLAGNLSSAPR